MSVPVVAAGASAELLRPLLGEGGGGLRIGAEASVVDSSFAGMLSNVIASANAHAASASQAAQSFAAGSRDDIHGTMISLKEADIELRLVANVRTKLVDAFNDLWRMNI
jgi:flagellar hook-basal body complex protein FliE